MKAILGTKIGMTQVFDENGRVHPVTVVDVSEVKVSRHLKDGEAVTQIELGKGTRKKPSKPEMGIYKEVSQVPMFKATFHLEPGEEALELGSEVRADIFESGELIDVIGTSKGKGFQGVMKRYNFKGGPKTHGSGKHRAPGSIGSGTTPGRVVKGKKMPGHMGNERKTIQNLKVSHIDVAENLIAIAGSVPGNNGDYLIIRPALKARQAESLKYRK